MLNDRGEISFSEILRLESCMPRRHARNRRHSRESGNPVKAGTLDTHLRLQQRGPRQVVPLRDRRPTASGPPLGTASWRSAAHHAALGKRLPHPCGLRPAPSLALHVPPKHHLSRPYQASMPVGATSRDRPTRGYKALFSYLFRAVGSFNALENSRFHKPWKIKLLKGKLQRIQKMKRPPANKY
jgi:hypothetical protein